MILLGYQLCKRDFESVGHRGIGKSDLKQNQCSRGNPKAKGFGCRVSGILVRRVTSYEFNEFRESGMGNRESGGGSSTSSTSCEFNELVRQDTKTRDSECGVRCTECEKFTDQVEPEV
jgi:hypothetical protein